MKIGMTKVVEVEAKTLKIHCKVSDRFCADVYDADGNCLGGQEDGYVPGFMPGNHYGDYIILDIDIDTGMITNWKKNIKPEQIRDFIDGDGSE
jgi:hypothetical protein